MDQLVSEGISKTLNKSWANNADIEPTLHQRVGGWISDRTPRDTDPLLDQCRTTVYDADPTLIQQRFNGITLSIDSLWLGAPQIQ